MILINGHLELTRKLELTRLFWRYDKNQDCRLSWKKLKEAFKELGVLFPKYRAYRALRYADENEDGYISENEMDRLVDYAYRHISEFEKVCLTKGNQSTKEILKWLFLRYDINRDGRLSKQELKNAFKYLGALFPWYRATIALLHADHNGDGYICEEEIDELVNYTYKLYSRS